MKKCMIMVCLSVMLVSGIVSSAHADTVEAGFFFDGVDLDTGTVEYDRSILVILMGETIEELLRPDRAYLADFSPSVDLSFEWDPAEADVFDLILQDDVKIAVLEDTSFDTVESIMPGEFDFTAEPYSVSIDSDDLVLAWTAEDRSFKLGGFRWSDWTLQFEFEELNIIPEPSTFLLLGLGLVGVVALVRWKKHIMAMLVIVALTSLWGAELINAQPGSLITIKKEGPGNGTILVGDQECDLACVEMSLPYVENTAVLLKAIPAPNSFFDRWETANGDSLEGTFHPQPDETILAIFAASIPATGGTVTLSDGTASVTFPAGATSQPLFVSIVKSEQGATLLSDTYDIRAFNAQGEPVTQFGVQVEVTLSYNPGANIWGQLAVYYYDEVSNQWIALPSTEDPVNYTVTGFTTHFSKFKVGGVGGVNSCQVTNENDNGVGSLRQVLADAKSNGCTMITFASGVSTITLSDALEISSGTLEIDGGPAGVALSGNNSTRIFWIENGADVTLQNLTITDGYSGAGGGIYNDSGTLTIGIDTTVSGNTAFSGGGIGNDGTLIIKGTVSGNTADDYGGGISNLGVLTIADGAIITGNTATIDGGGIYTSNTFTGIPDYGSGNTPNNCGGPGCPSNPCQVTNENDNGPGSLRQVLADAESNQCLPPITFAAHVSTITLNSQLEITSGTLEIDGGAAGVVISGNNNTRVFYIGSGADVTFQNLTITKGKAAGSWPDGYGGGIYNNGGTITIGSGSTVSDNMADYCGGIYNRTGTLTIEGKVRKNKSSGAWGGIWNYDGTLIVSIGGAVEYNSTDGSSGGGIGNTGTLIVDGRISNNTVGWGVGGGISNDGGTVTIDGFGTISDNTADYAGGISNENGGTLTVNGTISDNTADYGGGIDNTDGTVTIAGSATIRGNTANVNAGGISNGGTLTVDGSVENNTAKHYGGGILNEGTLTGNGMIRYNTAGQYGGGIHNDGGSVNSTTTLRIYANTAGNCNNYYDWTTSTCILP